ncbi:MAG: GTP 3',8-cyclase MoaA [Deltaproteobacteria bacterium]|nr:GTP 3',8-cyclase MoaA [Deltaproteobacteria bacterium]
MQDNHKRTINYLRLSLTDRCNLRCVYCMPEEGMTFVPHAEILSYEEMLSVVSLCVQKGIRKVRLTGGEPLVRKGLLPFIEKLNKMEGLEEIALTTNGVLLKDFARDLRGCGICRINVSMDTLKAERFRQITRRDFFDRVWEGIREADYAGFSPIKINVVAMRGVNDDEVLDFARLTFLKPYHVRFIEMMPVGENNRWARERFLSVQEILDTIGSLGPLRPVHPDPLDGPAQYYALEGAKGQIGLIGALSHHFCQKCNRLRLTADGRLRGCLFSDQETDIKTPLRDGKGDGYLLDLIGDTILNKPKSHGLNPLQPRKCVRSMNSIGG